MVWMQKRRGSEREKKNPPSAFERYMVFEMWYLCTAHWNWMNAVREWEPNGKWNETERPRWLNLPCVNQWTLNGARIIIILRAESICASFLSHHFHNEQQSFVKNLLPFARTHTHTFPTQCFFLLHFIRFHSGLTESHGRLFFGVLVLFISRSTHHRHRRRCR